MMARAQYPDAGTALVLAGPQGCGKTRIAHQLAEANGKFIEIYAGQFSQLARLLDESTKTVIVEGLPALDADLKRWITEKQIAYRLPYRDRTMMPTPRFIFCTSNPADLAKTLGSRHFVVVRLEKQEGDQ